MVRRLKVDLVAYLIFILIIREYFYQLINIVIRGQEGSGTQPLKMDGNRQVKDPGHP